MIVDGKKIASHIQENLKTMVQQQQLKKSLAIFYIGEHTVTDKFIALKKEFGKEIGSTVEVFRYSKNISEVELLTHIETISKNFDGIVIQLPLPKHINKKKILNSVPKEKDIDVLGDERYQDFTRGDFTFLPPVVGAVSEIFDHYHVSLEAKNVVVVGDGLLVGRPVFDWLITLGCNPVLIQEHTENKEELYKQADVIISGAGRANLIQKDFVKEGVILVDAGSSLDAGEVAGDIAKNCAEKASLFSQVPGGVGPITIAILFKNLYN